jgi:hypothetical protein
MQKASHQYRLRSSCNSFLLHKGRGWQHMHTSKQAFVAPLCTRLQTRQSTGTLRKGVMCCASTTEATMQFTATKLTHSCQQHTSCSSDNSDVPHSTVPPKLTRQASIHRCIPTAQTLYQRNKLRSTHLWSGVLAAAGSHAFPLLICVSFALLFTHLHAASH